MRACVIIERKIRTKNFLKVNSELYTTSYYLKNEKDSCECKYKECQHFDDVSYLS